jgi:hypothetical protein
LIGELFPHDFFFVARFDPQAYEDKDESDESTEVHGGQKAEDCRNAAKGEAGLSNAEKPKGARDLAWRRISLCFATNLFLGSWFKFS